MSRIGQQPVEIPDKVKVDVSDQNDVSVKGPLGELAFRFHPEMSIGIDGDVVRVTRPSDAREHRALHGMTRAILANMVEGVFKGFEKRLQLNGVGYRAELSGKSLTLRVGYSHPVEITPRDGIEFEVPDNTTVVVRGCDKQAVGQTAAELRSVRPVEPYRGQGIRYSDEKLRRKAGKTRAGE